MKNSNRARVPGRPKNNNEQEPIYEIIIKTASRLFMERGYEQVSLQQIANTCDVSKPSIYYYFVSKPELFKTAITTMLSNVYKKMHSLLNESETFELGLTRVAESRLANPHAELETIINEAQAHLNEEQIQDIRDAELQIYHILSKYFEEAMDQNLIRRNDPMLLAQLFSTMLLIGNRKDTMIQYGSNDNLGKLIVDIFLEGIMKR